MTRPTLVILCGPPGSGKTSYAKKYIFENDNTIHLSSDSIRAELWGSEATQGDNSQVFTLMQQRAVEALNNGQSVVYDSTAMTRKDRTGIIAVCPQFVQIECHIIFAPIPTCVARDATRERTVGKDVIDRMLKRFQMPYYDEGIDTIKIIDTDKFNYDKYYANIMNSLMIPHDNPNHTLSIFDHCASAEQYAIDKGFTKTIQTAARLHDCGKSYVKSFVNTKGETTDVAHYYQHQCVGAWIACGITHDIDILWLISTHMDVFSDTKYYHRLPPYLKQMVDQLHEADVAAH